jgi:hypothetical protein
MCPACLTVAALSAAKLASVSGLSAYCIKKWLAKTPHLPASQPLILKPRRPK